MGEGGDPMCLQTPHFAQVMKEREDAVVVAGVDGIAENIRPLGVVPTYESVEKRGVEIETAGSERRFEKPNAFQGSHEYYGAPRTRRGIKYNGDAGVF